PKSNGEPEPASGLGAMDEQEKSAAGLRRLESRDSSAAWNAPGWTWEKSCRPAQEGAGPVPGTVRPSLVVVVAAFDCSSSFCGSSDWVSPDRDAPRKLRAGAAIASIFPAPTTLGVDDGQRARCDAMRGQRSGSENEKAARDRARGATPGGRCGANAYGFEASF